VAGGPGRGGLKVGTGPPGADFEVSELPVAGSLPAWHSGWHWWRHFNFNGPTDGQPRSVTGTGTPVTDQV